MFKDKLKELRDKNNISQYQLAEKIYVSRSAIAKWESGLGMPSADSLEMLCKFFDVTKEELLEENDPSIVINNVQKKSKKIIILLSIIVGILLFATCASLLETIIQFKIDEEYAYHRNEFYNEKTLSDFKLSGLEKISSDDFYTIGTTAFKAKIDSHETFDSYANYLYDKLKYSTEISYLSTAYNLFKNRTFSDFNYSPSDYDNFLIPSQNINDHILKIENNHPTIYAFYYFTKLEENRLEKEAVTVNRILLEFNEENAIHQFEMYMDKIEPEDEKELLKKSYLAKEYFNIKNVNINKENFNEYFDVVYGRDYVSFDIKKEYCVDFDSSGQYNYLPFYKLFTEITFYITVTNKEGVETKHIYTEKYLNIANIEMKLPLYELGISVYDTFEFDLDFTFYYESDLYILDKVE